MSRRSGRISLVPWSRLCAVLTIVGAVSGGCSHADTVVQVQVQGGVMGIQQLGVTLTIAGQTRVILVPPQPKAISLPTSFTVQIDRSLQGQLDVGLNAFDGSNVVIGQGTASLPALSIGQTNQVVVNLTPGGGPPDGGADGAPDTSPGDTAPGDTPVDSGTGGSGGDAGATGSGGAGGGNGGSGGGASGAGGSASGGSGTAGSGGGGSGIGGSGAGGDSSGGRGGGGGSDGGGNDDGGVDAPDA
jgi:hypothetical protein